MQNHHAKFAHLLILGFGIVCLPCHPAKAEENLDTEELETNLVLEEVIVTSRKRLELISDTPLSLKVVTGDLIQDRNILNMQELSMSIPNVDIKESTIGDYVFIRGVGSGINAGFEQTVGTYVDGVYFGRSQLTRAPFHDIERVEVLRGPQGILFGKNTVAGAISITTVDPQAEFGGNIAAYWSGAHDDYTLDATVNLPLSDTVFARISARQSGGDGFSKNLGKNDYEPERDIGSVRIGLSWDITSNQQLVVKFGSASIDVDGFANEVIACSADYRQNVSPNDDCADNWRNLNGGAIVYSADASHAIDFGKEGIDSDIRSGSINYTADIGEFTFTSITGYANYDLDELTDGDFSPSSLLLINRIEDFSQYSQEFRITSPAGETFEWLAGIYWQQADLEAGGMIHLNATGLVPGLAPPPSSRTVRFEQDSESYAVFGQLTVNFTAQLRSTLGLRYAVETKDALNQTTLSELGESTETNSSLIPIIWALPDLNSETYAPIEQTRSEKHLSPSLSVQYDWNDDMMTYASVTRGFKGGGFDFLLGKDEPEKFEYEDEQVLALELGSKTKLAGGRGEINLALFRSKFEDVQVSIFNGALDLTVENAAEIIAQGLEIDGRWIISREWVFGFAAALLDSEYDSFPNGQCWVNQNTRKPGSCVSIADPNNPGSTLNVQDLSGQNTLFAPDYTFNLDLSYQTALSDRLNFLCRLDYQLIDNYSIDPDNDPEMVQDAYQLWNLRIALSDPGENWSLALIGKNLGDEYVKGFGTDIPLQPGSYFAQPGPGRTTGLQFDWRF